MDIVPLPSNATQAEMQRGLVFAGAMCFCLLLVLALSASGNDHLGDVHVSGAKVGSLLAQARHWINVSENEAGRSEYLNATVHSSYAMALQSAACQLLPVWRLIGQSRIDGEQLIRKIKRVHEANVRAAATLSTTERLDSNLAVMEVL